ncbi:Cell division protein FtsZ 1 [Candidatus Lokiarchaeum ossiferum]|uniref:Cell division protein FtsZ n=1 Tax=Candidatus Lokiarchaeum ossiferum TaxID=2951803 RepID=A0ABY6HSH2_9ARCH|nr:Cell division protein FtsZ 1 [Candidatus Lokiarchaeum sp. B-35]
MKRILSHVEIPKQSRAPFSSQQPGIGQANIIIIGCGGAGNNTVDRLMKIGIRGARCIAINTDQQHLNAIQAHERLLIGKNLTRGLGAGGQPDIGRSAAEESQNDLTGLLRKGDLVFITCGMGGGTGTGSAPIVAEIAKNNGAIVVGVITMPFEAEMGRIQKAKEGVKILRNFVDTLVMIDNNRLLEIAADLPITEAFSLADEVLATMVKGITETISLPSLINLDYADIRTILTSGGVAIVGIGEGDDPQHRIEEAIDDALNSPLLEFDISGAQGALIHVTGGDDLTLVETTKVANLVTERMDPNAMVIWGARVDPNMTGAVRVMLLITGVKSSQLLGNSNNRFLSTDFAGKSGRTRPNLADEFFNISEIRSINEENLNLF